MNLNPLRNPANWLAIALLGLAIGYLFGGTI
jgi:hypothetical protein